MKKWFKLFQYDGASERSTHVDNDTPDPESPVPITKQNDLNEEQLIKKYFGEQIPPLVPEYDDFDTLVNQKVEDFLDRLSTDEEFSDELLQLYSDLRSQSETKRQILREIGQCPDCLIAKNNFICWLENKINEFNTSIRLNTKTQISPDEMIRMKPFLEKYLNRLRDGSLFVLCHRHHDIYNSEYHELEAILERVLSIDCND